MRISAQKIGAALVVAALVGAPSGANAVTFLQTTYDLKNVQLSDGGVLNGGFTIDSYGYILDGSWSLTTTAGSVLDGSVYLPPFNTTSSGYPITTIDFYANGSYEDVLQLQFQTGLGLSHGVDPIVGGTGGPSYECDAWSCPVGSIRYVESGFFASRGA